MNEKRGLPIVVGLLGVASLTGIAVWAASKKPAPPAEESAATVQIEVRDAQGNIVLHNSPVNLNEGASYTFNYAVTNTSTRGGVPWPVTFTILHQVTVYGQILARDEMAYDFAAGQARSFGPFPFTIPWGTGGKAGAIDVLVQVPPGIVASGTEMISVVSVAIVYGAVVVIGV